jgi:hypothetical protein
LAILFTSNTKVIILQLNMYVPDLESNFAIAITGMTVVCMVLVVVPIVLMLRDSFRIRGRIRTS